MNINQIMNPSVKTVPCFASLRDAAEIMDQEHVGVLVVASDDELLGTITAKDIILHAISDGKSIYQTTVEEVMTVSAPDSYKDSVDEAMPTMTEKQAQECLW